MNLFFLPIIIGIGLSSLFIVDFLSVDVSHTNIDPKILEFYDEFVLQSDVDVYAITILDDTPSMLLTVSETSVGYVLMDNPLFLFQESFPNENVTTLVVLVDDNEIPHEIENNMLRFDISNSNTVLVQGK